MANHRNLPRACAWSALFIAVAVCVAASLTVDGFRAVQHGMGLLAAESTPSNWIWRGLGHWAIGLLAILPGLAAIRDGERKARRALRIAGYLWTLGALAYLLQGFWPLNLHDLDAPANQWHSLANSVWWLSVTAAALGWAIARPSAPAWTIAAVTVLLGLCRALEWLPQGTLAIAGWGQLFIWLAALVQDRRRALE